MVMKMPSPTEIEELNTKYAGKRIRAVAMPRDPHPVEPGTEGTCIMVDGAGQLVMKWDTGSTLSLIPGVDTFVIITLPGHECKLADLVTCPVPIENPTDKSVSFQVTCRICGMVYHKVYSRNEGLWDPVKREYVKLEP